MLYLSHCQKTHATALEAEIRRMLGLWVSELEPCTIWQNGVLLGLGAVEMQTPGCLGVVIIPATAVSCIVVTEADLA